MFEGPRLVFMDYENCSYILQCKVIGHHEHTPMYVKESKMALNF